MYKYAFCYHLHCDGTEMMQITLLSSP